MYIYFVEWVLSRGRGVLLIVLCDGPDKKRNDFWPGPLATRPAELWELENKIRWGRQGGLGGLGGLGCWAVKTLTHCMHCIFYGASTRDHVSHGMGSGGLRFGVKGGILQQAHQSGHLCSARILKNRTPSDSSRTKYL